MQTHGFTLIHTTDVTELSSTARLWRHDATGAELLSFSNSDENKVFGVSFRTPPADSTGVAHILEHSVLCGSEKFPVKEPFVELLKGSLQTFLNAFTYPDKTCYPVASANLKDFRNLTDVYLDAVFFPHITESIFQQEGWHLEPENESGKFSFKGVVYNEMKGAFSSPESVLMRYCLHALFPDTVYSLESGGDPKDIPALTYENFVAFHKSYYHPSNGRFFFWGDDPEEERLAQLGAVLARFTTNTVQSSIGLQQPITKPRTLTVPFAASGNEEADKGMVVVNWLGPDCMDMELGLGMRMLEHVLLGMPASPLRRALIESGLGEDLAGQGLETELRQLTFDAGLKGIDVADAPKIEALILQTLQDIARQGVPSEMTEAAVNSIEFSLRENNTGRFPVGLSIMLRALTTWLHDGDPITPLRFEKPLQAIKDKLAAGEKYFEGLITTWLLNNQHRVTVILTPDTELTAKQEQAEAATLAATVQGMSPEQQANAVAQAAALQEWQATPNTPEELDSIPRLHTADLPRENATIPTTHLDAPHAPVFFHGLPTGGIVYIEAAFDLAGIPQNILPLLPLFGRALLEMGTKRQDFVALNMAIARKTGGMDADTLFVTEANTRKPVAKLILSGKAAPDKITDLFELMTEVLTECSLDQQDRFQRMVLEEKARMEHSLVPSGHTFTAMRLRAAFSSAGSINEQTGGISYLLYLRKLADRVAKDWSSVLADLQSLKQSFVHRGALSCNTTGLPEQQDALQSLCNRFAEALPAPVATTPEVWNVLSLPAKEAFILPAQVNYMGKGINLFDVGYTWHGSASVILKYLRTGYLWDRVRVQGGAYGCMCGLDRMSGAFFMASYRDPNTTQTLDVYDAVAHFLASQTIGKAELDAAIVGAIGELDTYLLPDAKGSTAFIHHLTKDTKEIRRQMRDEILGTTAAHFAAFGQTLEVLQSKAHICGLGGAALERAAKESGWEITNIM